MKILRKKYAVALAALVALLCMAGAALAENQPAVPEGPTVTLSTSTITLDRANPRPYFRAEVTPIMEGTLSVTDPTGQLLIDVETPEISEMYRGSYVRMSPGLLTTKNQTITLTTTFTTEGGYSTSKPLDVIVNIEKSGNDPELLDVAAMGYSNYWLDFDPEGWEGPLKQTHSIFTFNSTAEPTVRLRNAPEGFTAKIEKVSDGVYTLTVDASKAKFTDQDIYAEMKLSLDGVKPLFYDLNFWGTGGLDISGFSDVILTEDEKNEPSQFIFMINPDIANATPEFTLSPSTTGLKIFDATSDSGGIWWNATLDASNVTFAPADQAVTVTVSVPNTDIKPASRDIILGGTGPLVRRSYSPLSQQPLAIEVDDFDIGRDIYYELYTANTSDPSEVPQVKTTDADGLMTAKLADEGEINIGLRAGRGADDPEPYYGALKITIDEFTPAKDDRVATASAYVEGGVQDVTVTVTFKGTGKDDNNNNEEEDPKDLGNVLTPTDGTDKPTSVDITIVAAEALPQDVKDAVGKLIEKLPDGSVVSAEQKPTADTGGMIPLAGSMSMNIPAEEDDAVALTYAVDTAKLAETVPSFDNIAALPEAERKAELEAMEEDGLRVIYEYVDNASGTEFVTLIGFDGISYDGEPLTWARALDDEIVVFDDGQMKINYVVKNAAGSPSVVAGYIIIPDGRADDKILDPLWMVKGEKKKINENEDPEGTSGGGVGCDAGAGAIALLALALALKKKRR